MKRFIVTSVLAQLVAILSYSQSVKLGTIYYDKDWRGVSSAAFASLYRIYDANGNSDTSGFFLGWDSKEKQDLFNGVMEGINVDEYITFDCERVTGRGTRALGSDSVQTTSQGKSYGKGVTLKRIDSNMPKTLRRR